MSESGRCLGSGVRNPEVKRMLLVRDRLRSRPDERDLCQRSKRELAARRWNYCNAALGRI